MNSDQRPPVNNDHDLSDRHTEISTYKNCVQRPHVYVYNDHFLCLYLVVIDRLKHIQSNIYLDYFLTEEICYFQKVKYFVT